VLQKAKFNQLSIEMTMVHFILEECMLLRVHLQHWDWEGCIFL